MKRTAILTLAILFIISSYCFADKQEWVDKNFDFTKVKTVFIFDPVIDKSIFNGINEKIISEIFADKSKLDKVKILRLPEVVLHIKDDTGIDIVELNKENPKEAANVLNNNLYRYADLIICSNISEFGTGSQYRGPSSYNTTSYQTSQVIGPNGNVATVRTPVTQSNLIPGRNVPVAYANVKFDIYDSRTLKPVFTRIDKRDRVNALSFENTEPKNLYERITKSFFEDIDNMIK